MIKHQIFMIVAGLLCGSFLFGSFLPRIIKKIDVTELAEDHNPGTVLEQEPKYGTKVNSDISVKIYINSYTGNTESGADITY